MRFDLFVRRAATALLLIPAAAPAQGAASSPALSSAPAPTCAQAVDSLDSKIRQNYAGYLLEVKGARRDSHDALVQGLRLDAAARPFADCFPLLKRLADAFDDPHLFVFQSPSADSAGVRRRRAAGASGGGASVAGATDESAARAALAARAASLDPIEGIWFDGPVRYVVTRDAADAGRFTARLLTADGPNWPVGAVRGSFTRDGEGRYTARLLDRDFGERQLDARLHRRVILRLSPGMWGKLFPVPAAEAGFIDTTDVHRPRLVVRERSVVVTMPSHDGRFMRALDSMVVAADSAIRSRGLLIVDLRGNEGGGSLTSRALHPYITTPERKPTPYDSGAAVMLSSPAQVAYAKRFTGTDTSAFVRSLVARMEANPGALVLIEETPSAPRPEASYAGDWQVVVLTDRGTVSAAEVLVLRALRSTRATVVGEPTAGALDYQSVQIVGLGLGDRRWALGYPTVTAHADLPQRGMRGKGIAPTVPMAWSTVPDAIEAVERRFARR